MTVYSWRLNPSDGTPRGKKSEKSLRELEAEIQQDLANGVVTNSTITINDLVNVFMTISKSTVKHSTYSNSYKIDAKRIDRLGWGKLKVKSITTSTAKRMIQQLFDNGATGVTVRRVKTFLTKVFNLAVEDDIIKKNPFSFYMKIPIILNEREALTQKNNAAFWNF